MQNRWKMSLAATAAIGLMMAAGLVAGCSDGSDGTTTTVAARRQLP